jgi:hypothetical protein
VILVVFVLLGFGVSDLLRWSRDRVGVGHAVIAGAGGATAVAACSAFGGVGCRGTVIAGVAAFLVLFLWAVLDHIFSCGSTKGATDDDSNPAAAGAVGFVIAAVGLSVVLSGAAPNIGGDIADWYSNLELSFASNQVPVDQFMTGVGGLTFLLATSNRIVGYTLAATNSSLLTKGEEQMRGGRLLGPMERLFVAAGIVSGSLAGAGLVIAAKGLLRFRELPQSEDDSGLDEVTEYFLVGTFTSVLVAAVIGALILAIS